MPQQKSGLYEERNFHVWMLSQRAIYKFPGKRVS